MSLDKVCGTGTSKMENFTIAEGGEEQRLVDLLASPQAKIMQTYKKNNLCNYFPLSWSYWSKVPGKEILSLLKPAGIWVAHHATWQHPMGPDGRGDCRTSMPYVTNYASFMSMRDPNSWHVPNAGKQLYGKMGALLFVGSRLI